MGEPLKVRKDIKIITVKDGVPTIVEFGGHRYGLLPPNNKLPNKDNVGK
jgi:hypothetical protein